MKEKQIIYVISETNFNTIKKIFSDESIDYVDMIECSPIKRPQNALLLPEWVDQIFSNEVDQIVMSTTVVIDLSNRDLKGSFILLGIALSLELNVYLYHGDNKEVKDKFNCLLPKLEGNSPISLNKSGLGKLIDLSVPLEYDNFIRLNSYKFKDFFDDLIPEFISNEELKINLIRDDKFEIYLFKLILIGMLRFNSSYLKVKRFELTNNGNYDEFLHYLERTYTPNP